MKHVKLFFLVVAVLISNLIFANSIANLVDGKSLSYEIERLLDDSDFIIEEEFSLEVVFSLSEERKIQIYTIRSENEEVNKFIKDRLQGRKLLGKKWKTEKLYELPVRIEAGR